jgi:predicted aspartyl protease
MISKKGMHLLPGLALLFFLMAGGAGNGTSSPHPGTLPVFINKSSVVSGAGVSYNGTAINRAGGVPAADLSSSGYPVVDLSSSGYPVPPFPFPAVPVPALLPDADPVVIPLKRAGRLYLIEAVIDGVAGNLVFDTGARELLLNKTYFRNHVTSGSVNSSGITGGVSQVELITAGKVEFAGLAYEKLRAEVTDLAHIENRRGVKILGLVGFSLLKKFDLVFDPLNGQLFLYRLDGAGRRNNGVLPPFRADHRQKIPGTGHVVFMKGMVAGKTLNFCFDTAAETNVISKSAHKSVLSTITITRRSSLKGAGSGTSEVLFGTMNDFSLGDRKIDNMETVITSLFALDEVYNTSLDGVLGYSFFRNGEVNVNFVTREVGFRFLKGGDE